MKQYEDIIKEQLEKCALDKFTGSVKFEIHFRDGGICNGTIERKESIYVKKPK